jgi:hypothetical protein
MKILVVFLSLVTMSSGSAAIVTYEVSGTFSDNLFGSAPPSTFPFPNLINGSFDGHFQLDTDQIVSGINGNTYALYSVDIDIVDSFNITIHTITDLASSQLRTVSTQQIALFFGDSADTAPIPNDLRLFFNGVFPGENALPTPEEITSGVFGGGFTSVTADPNPPLDFWGLDVASAVVHVVPVPAAVWLFGSALGLLGWMRRKAA